MSETETDLKQADILIGQNLRFLRESAGKSQKDLADKLGVTFQQVQKYEKGLNRLSAGRLFLISRYLNIPLDYFFHGIGGVNLLCMNFDRPDRITTKLIHQVLRLQNHKEKKQVSRILDVFLTPAK